jgi:hypothetical protein
MQQAMQLETPGVLPRFSRDSKPKTLCLCWDLGKMRWKECSAHWVGLYGELGMVTAPRRNSRMSLWKFVTSDPDTAIPILQYGAQDSRLQHVWRICE